MQERGGEGESLSERNRCINVLELSRVFAKVQQNRKKTQRHVERERERETLRKSRSTRKDRSYTVLNADNIRFFRC